MSRQPLEGRIAVVTGASAGIGRAVAADLAGSGARVVVNARRADRLRDLVEALGPDRAVAVPGDATEWETIDACLDAARDRFGDGGREADLVVVNAGRGLRGGVYDSDPERWEDIFRVNLLGAVRLMRRTIDRWIGAAPPQEGPPPPPVAPTLPAGWPEVTPRDLVVMGSTVGRHVSPFSALYGSAKAGVHMAVESLRRVAAPHGVRVTLIEPGVVRTEFQEAARYDPESFGAFMDRIAPVLEAEDVAEVVRFVVSHPAGVHVNDVMIRPTRQEYP